MRLNKQVLFHY